MADEQSQPIPVEKGWPLLGILPQLFKGDPFKYFIKVMLERGDLVILHFGPQPIYLVSHPDYLKRVLWENSHNYIKPDMMYNTAREVTGNGLITSSGDFWLRQRRMIQPHLHRKQLGHLFTDITESITEVLKSWEVLAEKNVEIELGEKMGEISSNVIVRTMFGKGILPAAETARIGLGIKRIIKYSGETLYSSMVPKWFPIPGRQQFLRDLSETREMVNQIIAKCREDKETSASLIKMLINAVDEESQQQMTEQQLFDETMTIFLAGYESTATALTWLAVVIDQNPHVYKKLRAEIDQVLGGRVPSFDDVPRLTYTRQVFMEILRMYTVAPFVVRSLTEADQLGKYHIPANALLFVFFHGAHHHPAVWDKPEVFDPDRFEHEKMANRHPFGYLPFSTGPRKCAGDEFAMVEGPLAIAMMLQKYDFNVSPNQNFSAKLGGTIRPGNGVKATLSLRHSA